MIRTTNATTYSACLDTLEARVAETPVAALRKEEAGSDVVLPTPCYAAALDALYFPYGPSAVARARQTHREAT